MTNNQMKVKLANNILLEIEALKECTNLSGSLMLAELITNDAAQLAKIIKEEDKS